MSDTMILQRKNWGPGFGGRGRPGKVLTNCFRVQRQPETFIQQYDVAWSNPEIKDQREIMNYLIVKERIFGDAGIGAVYDGRAIIYLPGDKPGPSIVHTFSEGQARGRPPRPDREQKTMQVKITHALSINMIELANLVQAQVGMNANLLQALNALNVAIKYQAQVDHPSRKATFYICPPGDARTLGAGLEVWGGYFAAIRPAMGGLIMNFDRAAGAFKRPGNAVNILLEVFKLRDPRDLEIARMPPRAKLQLKRFLKNLSVKFKFSPDRNAKYKIRKVSEVGANEFGFDVSEGQRSNVASYIEQKYQTRLKFPGLPCVQVTKIAWYPLELMDIVPGTQFLGKLSPDQVTEMLKFTTMKPAEALSYLRAGMPQLHLGGKSPLLKAWNFDVEQRPVEAPSRQLDPPDVVYSNARGGGMAPQKARDGTWEIRDKGPLKPGRPVDRWFVVVFADDNPGRDGFPTRDVQTAISGFTRACANWGIRFSVTQPSIFHAGPTIEVERAIKDGAKRAGFSAGNPPQFVVTLIPTKSSPQYALIKQVCETKLNVVSQNMLIQKLRSAKGQYFSNVALKVNVKLHGTNQRVGDAAGWLPGFDKVPTIIFGADVTHPGPGSFLPSIAGVVASFDPYGTQYATEVRAQNSREETIVDLEEIAFKLIKNFGDKCGKPPQRIMFFRDGVAESQFDQVCRDEIGAIKSALGKLKKGYNPPITYIICGKRHHIRMYPQNPNDADRSGNVKAGTVVDTAITHPFYSDFYLMSHAGLLGTSRPTHYTVLLDESNLGPDQLQATAYYLAHIYARSTRSVSIASPAYYAHHVCFRARHHIGDDDSAASDMGSASPEQLDALRDQKLQFARSQLARGLGADIRGSLYFM